MSTTKHLFIGIILIKVFFPTITFAVESVHETSINKISSKEINIEIRTSRIKGFGPFRPGFDYLELEPFKDKNDSSSYKIPQNIHNVKYTQLWIFDKPLNINTLLLCGYNTEGKLICITDCNNNNDLTDDPIQPFPINTRSLSKVEQVENFIPISFYSTIQNKIDTTWILISAAKDSNHIFYSIAEHHSAIISIDNTEHKILITNSGLSGLGYNHANIALDNINQNISAEEIIEIGQYLVLNTNIYQFTKSNSDGSLLYFTQIAQNQFKGGMQKGFTALPISGLSFINKESISLNQYKGKYLLVLFWMTGCPHCIKELQNFRKIHDTFPENELSILGVVDDELNRLSNEITKYNLSWLPQLRMQDKTTKNDGYRIDFAPRTILLNPEGIIIHRDLRGEKLVETIRKYLKGKS